MIISKKIFLLVAICCISTYSFSQEEVEEEPNTLYNQFEELKDNSNTYQIYKVVKESSLNEYWRSVRDSLEITHSRINELNMEVSGLNAEVKKLKSDVSQRDSSLASQDYAIENITFLGMDMKKNTYSTITWTIIFILLISLLIVYFRFKNSNKVTVQTRKEYETLSTEFDDHRQRTRENETKLKRELQTEINRVEELKDLLGTRNG